MLRKSTSDQDLRDENHVKVIKHRIELTEKHFANLCASFGSYTRKTALLRDRGDNISRTLRDYTTCETLHRSLAKQLGNLADSLSFVEDYRQTLIDRLEVNVTGKLSSYDKICRSAKENVKATVRSDERLQERRRHLQKFRDKSPVNQQEVAEAEFTKARVEAVKSNKTLTDFTQSFEEKKLKDIKQILLNYVKSEMLFHAKALEIYTKAFNHIHRINEVEDMEIWHNRMRLSCPRNSQMTVMDISSDSGLVDKTKTQSTQSLVGDKQRLENDDSEEEDSKESDNSCKS